MLHGFIIIQIFLIAPFLLSAFDQIYFKKRHYTNLVLLLL